MCNEHSSSSFSSPHELLLADYFIPANEVKNSRAISPQAQANSPQITPWNWWDEMRYDDGIISQNIISLGGGVYKKTYKMRGEYRQGLNWMDGDGAMKEPAAAIKCDKCEERFVYNFQWFIVENPVEITFRWIHPLTWYYDNCLIFRIPEEITERAGTYNPICTFLSTRSRW